jgi:hypothetical protein
MKKIIMGLVLIMIVGTNLRSLAQTPFSSSKYPYSFSIPDGWSVKNKIYLPATDAKIVDGRGNSFIISVITMPNSYKGKSATQVLSQLTDDETKMSQSPTDFENIIITKRGTTYISGRPFYFVFCSTPFPDGLRLNHKMFYYFYKSHCYTIDCASISSMTTEVTPFLESMLLTLKFQ